MLDRTDDIAVAADNWLARFEDALAKADIGALRPLFHPDSHWRDVEAPKRSCATQAYGNLLLRKGTNSLRSSNR